MTRQASLICGLTLLAMAAGLAAAQNTSPRPTVAVFDFALGGTVVREVTAGVLIERGRRASLRVERTAETNLLTSKLITALAKSEKVQVVEREKMAVIMGELELTEAGLTDPERSVEAGKLLGADYLVFGSVNLLDPEVEFKQLPYDAGTQRIMRLTVAADIRVVEAETGRIVTAETKKARGTSKELNPRERSRELPAEFQHEVYDKLVEQLVDSVLDALFPIKVAAFSEDVAYLNRGGLEPGALYLVVEPGEIIVDPDTGEILGQTETRIATLRVTEGLQKLSKAEVTSWEAGQTTIAKGAVCRRIRPQEQEEGTVGAAG